MEVGRDGDGTGNGERRSIIISHENRQYALSLTGRGVRLSLRTVAVCWRRGRIASR